MQLQALASCVGTVEGCFCESHALSGISQPANTISAIAFLLVAGVLLRSNLRELRNWVYGLVLVVIGLGTAYYHARMTFLGQLVDFGGMNMLILLALFLYWAYARKPGDQALLGLAGVLVFLLLVAELLWFPEIRRQLFGFLIVLTILTYLSDVRQILQKENRQWFLSGLGILYILAARYLQNTLL